MRVVLSVYDKSGLESFARGLAALGAELVSTGGTKKSLEAAGIAVRGIEEITGFPEIMDGRVKTLHPMVHGGLLARRDVPDHMAQAQRLNITMIDMVVGNLYPFVETISKPDVSLEDALENIDIGGPTMLRAAAKNYPSVWVVSNPVDYDQVLEALQSGDAAAGLALRRKLAAKAFQHVAYYDTAVAGYLRDAEDRFPEELTLGFKRQQVLRYGENPHQQGALYREPLVTFSSLVTGEQQLGVDPSLCNIYDLSAALETVRDFAGRPAAAVIKHATPSGFAIGTSAADALRKAIHADATSAFGGIIGLNLPLDLACAEVVNEFKTQEFSNIDAVVAPGIAPEALDLLRKTRRRTVVFTVPPVALLPQDAVNFKQIPGGLLYQMANAAAVDTSGWKVATQAQPTAVQLAAMHDAWTLIRRIRSNTILVWDPKEGVTLGIGSGQVSRVGAARLALEQAGERARGAILASDSFFPFPDSVELAVQYGIGAIVQQGGSINDGLSVTAADQAGVPMVLTGERAFWH